MDKEVFESNYRFEETYWWYLGRRKIIGTLIRRYAPRRRPRGTAAALDAGCGTGIMLRDLAALDLAPTGIDRSSDALSFSHRRGVGSLVQGDICALPFRNESFDVVNLAGVLYHDRVGDDAGALRESFRVLKPGGIAVVDEAAYGFLLSRHNKTAGGNRRYTRAQLIEKARACDFEIAASSYWNAAMLPAFIIAAIVERFIPRVRVTPFKKIPRFCNAALKRYLYLEAFLMKFIRIPFGPSVIVVLKKSE